MTLRRLAVLQWLGLVAGAAVWAAQHVVGFGITQAECGAGGSGFGIANDTWQAALLGTSASCVLAAQAAAVAVLLATRSKSYEEDPPRGRIRFFAIAASAANAIFLVIIVLDGIASIAGIPCRQA
jgi:hypothetical protein